MATLTGWSLPLQIPVGTQFADHTYAESSDGHVWPCWGRSSGGTLIASGHGSSSVADCMSQSTSRAGIVYAVTGVCHQTANRILDPASVTVSTANGYQVSRTLYQTYGLNLQGVVPGAVNFATRRQSCTVGIGGGGIPPSGGPVSPLASPPTDPPLSVDAPLVAAIRQSYHEHEQAVPERNPESLDAWLTLQMPLIRRESELVLQVTLQQEALSPKIDEFVHIQEQALRSHLQILEHWFAGELAGEAFAHEVNRNVAAMLADFAKSLSPSDFRRHFGVDPETPLAIVDAEQMRTIATAAPMSS